MIPREPTVLQQRIESGKPVLVAELLPPRGSDPAPVRAAAKRYAGKVHALGVSDNRDGVCMSAIAAASLVASEGVEPILHVTTRDRNRIALMSECLGAQALGIRNLLCTTGTHQMLGSCRSARNVFDVDPIQLLAMYAALAGNKPAATSDPVACAPGSDGVGPSCLGATASPYADPIEMQVIRLMKVIAAGATFVITQPVFDVERFESWWHEVTRRGIHEKVAILAGIQVLTDAEYAKTYAERRPRPMIPQDMLQRLASRTKGAAQRAMGMEIAQETVKRLSGLNGLRGFEIRGDGDADVAVEFIEKTGLGTH